MKSELILKHKGLIIRVMKDLHCSIKNEDDFDDYFFIGLMGLLRGLKSYDETKGKSTYLYLCIKTALTNEFKRRKKLLQNSYKTISLNYIVADEIEFLLEQKEKQRGLLNILKCHKFIIKYLMK